MPSSRGGPARTFSSRTGRKALLRGLLRCGWCSVRRSRRFGFMMLGVIWMSVVPLKALFFYRGQHGLWDEAPAYTSEVWYCLGGHTPCIFLGLLPCVCVPFDPRGPKR
ncbi:hypothetical protein B0H65DRAFT_91073 [Neurospora tetraspora]|uniref:Uncharacterized protein n=1 Tax=Neurospora tetraspora TaxID=94610 RepID=A0AAE0JJ54_9PEZI|nr:hypothetical protein B0H65DRAFT_91073 [Neurospora tetraspora]